LAAEAKAKVEEETHTAEEVAFACTKATKQEAAAAAAKHTADVRAKEAHQEAAAAKEEAEAQAKAEVEAAASVKRQAEATAKADAQAEAADKHSTTEAQARKAFFERLPFAAAKAKEAEEKAREALVLEKRRQDEQLRAAEAERRRKEEEFVWSFRQEEFAAAKQTRAKEAQQADTAAKEEAQVQAKAHAEAAAAVKRQTEAKAKADAHAEAADKHSDGEEQAREAFLKRAASEREKAEVTGADVAAATAVGQDQSSQNGQRKSAGGHNQSSWNAYVRHR
jgi:colicin import membrane protein